MLFHSFTGNSPDPGIITSWNRALISVSAVYQWTMAVYFYILALIITDGDAYFNILGGSLTVLRELATIDHHVEIVSLFAGLYCHSA